MEGVFYRLIYLTLAEIWKTTTECFLMYDFKLFALASVVICLKITLGQLSV